MSDPADLVENTKTSLKILQSLGEAIPGGGIVKCISGIGLALVETAQMVRVNRRDCCAIAEEAARQILLINEHLTEDQDISDDHKARLECYWLWKMQ
ncbi:hypothetical protein SISSUDRAFT_705757 [Sistotremastrum suecicum HHB10207 ss-3]|uniref:Uncharacterized protein n=1 Tax=Sistotremastrum suecicum HHB10207 ss-3 TaxID=1314776 RepID=A0A166DTN3_9AGAM|nr:hypothetical protein SISSUDRAFT_705757 [Sistotremastrum suecicum HHB10207 ss-3]